MAAELSQILVPVDGSEGSRRAAAFAGELARRLGARLYLLHVHPLALAEVLGLRSVDQDEFALIKARVARDALKGARHAIGLTDVEVEDVVALGDPADEIIREASRLEVGLIVMGTRGLTPMKELILGSVSDKVVRHGPCAVTIVR